MYSKLLQFFSDLSNLYKTVHKPTKDPQIPNYTTPPAKRQKRKHTINLTNSPLLKMLLELSLISHSISHSVPLFADVAY